MRVSVTGGAGFIGSHIVDLLLAQGHQVSVIDNLATGARCNVDQRARFFQLDVRSRRLHAVIRAEQPEVICHQAAQMSVKASTDDPRHDAEVNVLGLLNVLQASVACGVRRIVFASSGATYGNPAHLPLDEHEPQRPASPYGISKLAGEHYLDYFLHDFGLESVALRYGNVYGPRQDGRGEAGVIAIFTRQLLAGDAPVIHWDGEQVRDYVFVRDVAYANVAAMTKPVTGAICIATGVATSVNRIYRLVCEALEMSVKPDYGPRRAGDVRAAYFNIARAREALDWSPAVTLTDGIAQTVRWLREQHRDANGN
jgi:UDP-glucose 4-epimerase